MTAARCATPTPGVAVARVEQIAPFQYTAIGNVITSYPNLQEIVWLQEEPRNMGAVAVTCGRACASW